jgi:ABC-type glycerol-3-phosphate transport system substrate-binding protein
MIKKFAKSALAGLLVAGAVALPASLPASAAEVTLRFAHFWPAVAGTHKNLFKVWADTV